MTYTFELLDTETDEVVEVGTLEAASLKDAQAKAEVEADYQGLFLGTVKEV